MLLRFNDIIFEENSTINREDLFYDFIKNVVKGNVYHSMLPRDLTPYYSARINDGVPLSEVRSIILRDFTLKRYTPAKKEKPLVEVEGEIIVNREELAYELAKNQLAREGLILNKYPERYTFLVEEYLQLIDRNKTANE